MLIGNIEFSGTCYLTYDANGTWLWSVKPVLVSSSDNDEEFEYRLPSKYINDSDCSQLYVHLPLQALPILIGSPIDERLSSINWNGIYKVNIERVDE